MNQISPDLFYKILARLVFLLISSIALPGCGEVALEIGYHPPGVPLEISINSFGEIEFELSRQIPTPLGVFEVGVVTEPQKYFDTVENVLLIRIDGQECIYDLNGQTFDVDLSAADYRLVSLQQKGGSIFIELQGDGHTVCKQHQASIYASDGASQSCPGASPSHLSVGASAYISVFQASVYQSPSELAPLVENKYLRENRQVTIIDGPICGPGNPGHVLFWKVRSEEIRFNSGRQGVIVGWVAEESGDIYLLRPR